MYRELIIVALLLMTSNAWSENAKLLLVRDAKNNRQCEVSVMHGKLYAVPNNRDLASVNTSLGLQLLTQVEELPFEGNAPYVSAIPDGTYKATIRIDASKPWMKGRPLRSWRLELRGTNPRTHIQFHYGKDKSWSQGCIILTGDGINKPFCRSNGAENSPEDAVAKVKSYVESKVKNSADKIMIKFIYNK